MGNVQGRTEDIARFARKLTMRNTCPESTSRDMNGSKLCPCIVWDERIKLFVELRCFRKASRQLRKARTKPGPGRDRNWVRETREQQKWLASERSKTGINNYKSPVPRDMGTYSTLRTNCALRTSRRRHRRAQTGTQEAAARERRALCARRQAPARGVQRRAR